MKRQFFASSVILFTILTGCASEPPTLGEATEFEQVCDRSNDGKRVAVEGFLTLPEEIPVGDTISVLLEIRPSEDVENLNGRVGVWTSYGSEANQVTPVDISYTIPGLNTTGSEEQPVTTDQSPISSTYTHADLNVTTSDGQRVTYTDRVRVSGKVVFPSSPKTTVISPCVLNNPLIERIQ
ncbi:MAG: hypothetical protein HC769_01895 [Cyanobacteria bacterium CRU_2_1]|nr:hypothetical protein [Cyanobacteria bacterium RU_5_0]NJR57710.1 hypothetical protein [Cyanobacteria bacterium CRU_2_1]